MIPTLTVGLLTAGTTSAQETSVFREADSGLTCAQIGDEAAQLSQAMGDATPQGGWLSSLGNLAKTGASLIIPGAGLAVAGADAVRQPGRERAEAEQAAIQNRWYYLNGLHAGRGCREQAAAEPAAMQAPAPGPGPGVQTPDLSAPVRSDR
ncbi:hypothetical protein [Brevundimonas sp. NIBR11]|uniref:hypothetical protein n=1 Tax=Brevundimonas sp. NIBR11 TaxID=3015999 RepID=UPI0022F09F6E|nr:hypothetical protein [Brevundimonas sp. NIBR11]